MVPEACPVCGAYRTLSPHAVEVHGCQWHYCTRKACAVPVLIRISDGEVIRVGKP